MLGFIIFLYVMSILLIIIGLIKPSLVIRWGEKKDRMYVLKILIPINLILVIPILFSNGAKNDSVGNSVKRISIEDFGDRWPFSVDSGTLSCVSYKAVVFETNGIKYAVNGMAGNKKIYSKIEAIWKIDEKSVKDMENVLKKRWDTKAMGSKPRISINPIIDLGLTLCKN